MDKILVPLDGKTTAERELALASQLVGQTGTLVLLRVPIVPDGLSDDPLINRTAAWQTRLDQATAVAETYLAEIAAQLTQPCHTIVQTGDPRAVIAAVAAREQVDMTLMTTEGRARFGQWLLGGVAEQVVRHASCPVLLLREEEAIEHIVVAVDGSAFAEQVLPFAVQVAQATGASVALLQVVAQATAGPAAQKYLDELAAKWRAEMLLDTAVLVGEPPADTMIEYLQTHDVDLLALATHGMSGTLAGMSGMYGSVAEKLVRNVDSSMLIMRPDQNNAGAKN